MKAPRESENGESEAGPQAGTATRKEEAGGQAANAGEEAAPKIDEAPGRQAPGAGEKTAPKTTELVSLGAGQSVQTRPDTVRNAATWGSIYNRVSERRDLCDRRVLTHDRSALTWQRWATPVALAIAILAGISGLSVVSNSEVAAVTFSLLTALLAAVNATLKPTETAGLQRAAATSYDRLRLKLEDFMTFELEDDWEGRPTREDFPEIRKRIQELDAELHGIEESHPPLTATFVRTYATPGRTSLALDAETYVSGNPITVSFKKGPGNAWDFVGIYQRGEDYELLSARFWQYVGGGQNATKEVTKGSLTFSEDAPWDGDQAWWPPEPGDYVVYFFENGTRRALAEASLSVTS